MSKYKKVNESIIDTIITKVFKSVADNRRSKALDDLAKKDPEFAKGMEGLKKMRQDLKKRLNTKAKRDAELQRIKNSFK